MTNQLAESHPSDCHPSPPGVAASTQPPLEISIDSSSSSSVFSILEEVSEQEEHNDVREDCDGLDTSDAAEVMSLLDHALALFDEDDDANGTLAELLMVTEEDGYTRLSNTSTLQKDPPKP